MSNATIEIIDFGGDNQRELETSGDKSCSLHQIEGTFASEISRQLSEKDDIQRELVWKGEKILEELQQKVCELSTILGSEVTRKTSPNPLNQAGSSGSSSSSSRSYIPSFPNAIYHFWTQPISR